MVKPGKAINISSCGKIIVKIVSPDNLTKEAENELLGLRKTAILKDTLSPINDDLEVLSDDNS